MRTTIGTGSYKVSLFAYGVGPGTKNEGAGIGTQPNKTGFGTLKP